MMEILLPICNVIFGKQHIRKKMLLQAEFAFIIQNPEFLGKIIVYPLPPCSTFLWLEILIMPIT